MASVFVSSQFVYQQPWGGGTGAMRFWQITIADNSKAPQQTYTALVPDDIDQGEISKNQLAFIALRGVNWGSFSAWIVTFLAPAK
ncbi:hypothetical protein [Corallococcus sp. AB018]|uniref:hypothetical protein n=1 Tax=Corallococcus sp. AB018 TaxID=2316715 RepID=UPI000F89C87C|nr:hypothetical protein [Corallococcus sp. AB018]